MTVIRKVIREICGHTPYEKKIMELLKQSKANAQKKAYKLAKKSLGNHKRALRKRNELQDAVARHEH
jgi:large subunit ribosomal protein L36e